MAVLAGAFERFVGMLKKYLKYMHKRKIRGKSWKMRSDFLIENAPFFDFPPFLKPCQAAGLKTEKSMHHS